MMNSGWILITSAVPDFLGAQPMATTLTPDQMKAFVRNHFEDFVNKRNAAVIHRNMTADFHDHDGPWKIYRRGG